MKILQIIDSLPATSGGARFVVNLAKKIAKRKINVNVLLIDGKHSHFLEELEAEGINVIVLDKNTTSRYNPFYVKQIARIMSDYDLVHVHIFPASYLVAIATLINQSRVPVIFTEHNSYNRRAINPYFKFIEKLVYSRFSKVVGISSAVKIFLERHLRIKEDKIVVIDNGVDFDPIVNSATGDRAEFNIPDTNTVLLMAARFAAQKDHETVIRALADLPQDYTLILAGDGPTLQKHKKTAEVLGVLHRIRFLGARSDIYEIIKMSDINILSSYFEGFGLSAVEAMAAGKPLIATQVPGISEVVDGAGLLFSVGDHAKLTALILQLGMDPIFYSKVSSRCSERSKMFDCEVMTDKYINLYQKTIIEHNA